MAYRSGTTSSSNDAPPSYDALMALEPADKKLKLEQLRRKLLSSSHQESSSQPDEGEPILDDDSWMVPPSVPPPDSPTIPNSDSSHITTTSERQQINRLIPTAPEDELPSAPDVPETNPNSTTYSPQPESEDILSQIDNIGCKEVVLDLCKSCCNCDRLKRKISRSCGDPCSAVTSFMLISIYLGLGLALPIAEIYCGVSNMGKCPVSNVLPVYICVSGSWLCIAVHAGFVYAYLGKKESIKTCRNIFIGILILFFIIWQICGSFWVYRLNKCTTEEVNNPNFEKHCFTTVNNATYYMSDTYCEKALYEFAQGDILAKWIMIVIPVVIAVVFFC